MNRITARWLLLPVLSVALVAAAGCGSSSSSKAKAKSSTSTTAAKAELTGTINGSGATFPATYYQAAIQAVTQANSGLTVNYNPTGSGQGQTDLEGQLVDFAGSDSTVKPEDVSKFKGGKFLYFPTVAAPITVSYNLSGVSSLQLSAPTIAKIFSGAIKTWNDAAIKSDNPDADLPSTAITVAVRSDGSGTTANFTKYLTKAAATDWALGSDKTVNWPSGVTKAEKNAGVAQVIKQTDGGIGYVDFSDAKASGLKFAKVKNASGSYVAASLSGASAAVAGAKVNADLTYDPLNASGKTAYAITAPTYILVYVNQTDKQKGTDVKGFLNYILTDGQELAASVDFAKLPADLASKAITQLDQIVIPS
jgi:phosphate transport system substrate-binding protein